MIEPRELFRRIQADDEEATTWLYEELKRRHFDSLKRKIGSTEAPDAFGELFVVLLTAIQRYQMEHPQFVWAFADRVRKSIEAHIVHALVEARNLIAIVQDNPHPDEAVLEAERRAIVRRMLGELPKKRARVIELCLEGRTDEEIARALHQTPGSIRKLKSKGTKSLREKLLKFPDPLAMAA